MAFQNGGFTVIFISRYCYIHLGAQQLWTSARAERTDTARAGASAQRWDMLYSSTKQAARGEVSGFCQQSAMVALGWLPRMTHSGDVSQCTYQGPGYQNGVAPPCHTLSSTKRKGFLETQSWGGGPYYPAAELDILMSNLNLSTQVACTTSNQQHIPPSSSCVLAGRARVKPALARQSLQEMGCSSIQLHSRVTSGNHLTTTYPVHKLPREVPTR